MRKSRYFIAIILCVIFTFITSACEKKTAECTHSNTREVIIQEATCEENGSKEIHCVDCDAIIDTVVVYAKGHTGSNVVDKKSLIEYSKTNNIATFHKTCSVCGQLIENEEFSVNTGAEEEYSPISPTVTLYNTENLTYGFTWNCSAVPFDSGIKIWDSTNGWKYYSAKVTQEKAYIDSITTRDYYICKVEVGLVPNTEYKYKLVDNLLNVESEEFSFTSVNPESTTFTFASFSDSQNVNEDGSFMNNIFSKMSNVDFCIHTGDICENSKIEQNWVNMLNYNRQYLAVKPIMITSGNHDTTYVPHDNILGTRVLYKHFNNNIPTQCTSVDYGYFYSFVYGNVKFIMLNTDNVENNIIAQAQMQWLENELKNKTTKWTIVSMHRPIYSVGEYSQQNKSLLLRNQLNNLFVKYGVDMVIQGHEHTIYKTYPIGEDSAINKADTVLKNSVYCDKNPNGVIYTSNGTSGNQTRNPESQRDSKYFDICKGSNSYSWAEYSVTNDTLTVSVKYLNLNTGAVIKYHSWGIYKT